MTQLIAKWSGMLATLTTSGLVIMASVAALAIIVYVVLGFFGDDTRKAGTVKTLVIILVFCGIAALGTELIQWAM